MVEVNQSGLLMETLIDITPKDPLPAPSVGPLDPDCSKQGLILCDKERMKGHQGVSLDALVGIFTRLGRDMEEIGVTKSYKLAEKVASIMEEAQPLLTRVQSSPLFSLTAHNVSSFFRSVLLNSIAFSLTLHCPATVPRHHTKFQEQVHYTAYMPRSSCLLAFILV